MTCRGGSRDREAFHGFHCDGAPLNYQALDLARFRRLEAAKQPVVYKVMMLRDRFAQDVKAHDGCGEAGPGVDRD